MKIGLFAHFEFEEAAVEDVAVGNFVVFDYVAVEAYFLGVDVVGAFAGSLDFKGVAVGEVYKRVLYCG